jgi:hypothetical protein
MPNWWLVGSNASWVAKPAAAAGSAPLMLELGDRGPRGLAAEQGQHRVVGQGVADVHRAVLRGVGRVDVHAVLVGRQELRQEQDVGAVPDGDRLLVEDQAFTERRALGRQAVDARLGGENRAGCNQGNARRKRRRKDLLHLVLLRLLACPYAKVRDVQNLCTLAIRPWTRRVPARGAALGRRRASTTAWRETKAPRAAARRLDAIRRPSSFPALATAASSPRALPVTIARPGRTCATCADRQGFCRSACRGAKLVADRPACYRGRRTGTPRAR